MKFGEISGQFRLTLSRDCHFSYPDLYLRDQTFASGSVVVVDAVDCVWPGKPMREGTVGWIVEVNAGREPIFADWEFWTSCDPDTASIFSSDAIELLEVPDTPQWREIFVGAPFPLKFVSEQPPS